MKHLTTIALMLFVALACSQPPEAQSPTDVTDSEEEAEPVAVVPEGPPECVDENNEPIECELDSECCEGFECGYDPEGSTRIKTCIWAGG